MANLSLSFKSRVLGIMTSVEIILPECAPAANGSEGPVWDGNEPLPVLYLLHGTGDDQTAWGRNTSIARYVENKKLAVVMPAGNRSVYTNQRNGYDYFTFLTEELPEVCRRIFKLSKKREETFIGGLSMGGYGALKAGLTMSEKYGAILCLSGGADRFSSMLAGYTGEGQLADDGYVRSLKDGAPADYMRLHDFLNTFGRPEDYYGGPDDTYAMIERLAKSGKTPPAIYIAIGTEDIHYEPNIRLRKALDASGFAYTYDEAPGIHEWAFWDKYIQIGLDFLQFK